MSESVVEGARMPLLGHLGELRARLRNAVIAVLAAFAICYKFRYDVFFWLAKPMVRSLEHAYQKGWVAKIIITKPTEAFLVFLQVAGVAALFVASPVVIYQLWRFIAPGLYPKERRWALPVVALVALLFITGGLFCYFFVLTASYDFFLEAAYQAMLTGKKLFSSLPAESILQPMIGTDELIGLTLLLIVVFGLVFELPLILAILSLLGMVSARALWRWNRYAILLFVIVGAVLTPGDLVVGQLLMAGSLTILYNASIGIAWLVQKKRKNPEASGDPVQHAKE